MVFIRNRFSAAAKPAIPQSHLRAADVHMILGCFDHEHPGEARTRRIEDPQGNYAAYTFSNFVDGKTFELRAEIHRDGKDYKTHVLAEKSVNPGVYEIKSIVFDNVIEKLDSAKQIYAVLNYIGVNHVRGVFFKRIPDPHENKGPFSKVGRFTTRHMPKSKAITGF